jgi:hypothetical protein
MEQAFLLPSGATRLTSAVNPSWFSRAAGRPTIATPQTAPPSAHAKANNPDKGGPWWR